MIGMKNPETGKLERLTGSVPTTTEGGFTPTPDQLTALNSGITAETVSKANRALQQDHDVDPQAHSALFEAANKLVLPTIGEGYVKDSNPPYRILWGVKVISSVYALTVSVRYGDTGSASNKPSGQQHIILDDFFSQHPAAKERLMFYEIQHRTQFGILWDSTGICGVGHSMDNVPWRSLNISVDFDIWTSAADIMIFNF